jgi:hypothetical protein
MTSSSPATHGRLVGVDDADGEVGLEDDGVATPEMKVLGSGSSEVTSVPERVLLGSGEPDVKGVAGIVMGSVWLKNMSVMIVPGSGWLEVGTISDDTKHDSTRVTVAKMVTGGL